MDDKHNVMCPVYASQRVLTFMHVLLSQAVFMAVTIRTYDCQEASVCIRANSFDLKLSIHTMHFDFLLLLTWVQLPVQVSVVKVLYGLCETGHISQGGPALSHRMLCFREFFLIHTYSPKHLSLRLKSLNQHYADLKGPRFSKRPDSFGFYNVVFCLFSLAALS